MDEQEEQEAAKWDRMTIQHKVGVIQMFITVLGMWQYADELREG